MAKRASQQSFKGFAKVNPCFGGRLLKGHPKTKRPLDSKLPVHLVLRARQGGMRKPRVYGRIEEILDTATRKYGVRIYEKANVGSHIHMVIRVTKLSLWAGFIREVSGRVASLMREFLRLEAGESFWMYRPFTRLVSGWKKAYWTICEYVRLNWLEAEGHIERSQTKTLKDLRAIFDG